MQPLLFTLLIGLPSNQVLALMLELSNSTWPKTSGVNNVKTLTLSLKLCGVIWVGVLVYLLLKDFRLV